MCELTTSNSLAISSLLTFAFGKNTGEAHVTFRFMLSPSLTYNVWCSVFSSPTQQAPITPDTDSLAGCDSKDKVQTQRCTSPLGSAPDRLPLANPHTATLLGWSDPNPHWMPEPQRCSLHSFNCSAVSRLCILGYAGPNWEEPLSLIPVLPLTPADCLTSTVACASLWMGEIHTALCSLTTAYCITF